MSKDLFSEWVQSDKEIERTFYQENFILEVTEAIHDEMESSGVSRKELSDKLGKSRAYVTQLLSGSRNMTLRTLSDICYALGVYPEVRIYRHKVEEDRHISYDDLNKGFEYVKVANQERMIKPKVTVNYAEYTDAA